MHVPAPTVFLAFPVLEEHTSIDITALVDDIMVELAPGPRARVVEVERAVSLHGHRRRRCSVQQQLPLQCVLNSLRPSYLSLSMLRISLFPLRNFMRNFTSTFQANPGQTYSCTDQKQQGLTSEHRTGEMNIPLLRRQNVALFF